MALLRRDDGRYLLIRRAAGIPGGGVWCPVSGRPEENESLEEAVAREVMEEVALEVEVGEKVHECLTHDASYRLVWFACRERHENEPVSKPIPDPKEVAEWGWFLPQEAIQLRPMFDATRAYFRALSEGLTNDEQNPGM